jgi:hypothetical protein
MSRQVISYLNDSTDLPGKWTQPKIKSLGKLDLKTEEEKSRDIGPLI